VKVHFPSSIEHLIARLFQQARAKFGKTGAARNSPRPYLESGTVPPLTRNITGTGVMFIKTAMALMAALIAGAAGDPALLHSWICPSGAS